MGWNFETDPEFQAKLDWTDDFVRREVEPLDLLCEGNRHAVYDSNSAVVRKLVRPLQSIVKEHGLWAAHLPPELGGQGFGQLRLALLNEVLGRSIFAPRVFGCQAPDSGNAELIAHFGSDEQKRRYLKPLLDGDIVSSFAMTEPQGGSDPKEFTCSAWRDGDDYVIEGEKWFASNARYAEFLLVMVVTDPSAAIHQGASILLVPKDTPGVHIVRNVGMGGEPLGEGSHGYIRFDRARVPLTSRIGDEGRGFEAAQVRLGGGRVHHAMRTVGQLKTAFDMLCERAVSRHTQGGLLAEKQMVQEMIADSYIQMQQFRLHVLYTAWLIDREKSYNRIVRKEIAAIKVATGTVMRDIVWRAMHVHGSLGVSNELPLAAMWHHSAVMATVDGPTEVHKIAIAKAVLRDYKPSPGLFPTAHLPPLVESARKKYAHLLAESLEHEIANS
jgi:acyl-CoA dehydrogenase